MSLRTRPLFYYGFYVDANNIYLNFDEGVGELTTTIRPGYYSFEGLALAVSVALNNVGTQPYSVTTDRENRTYTISADDNFSLLFNTGSNAGGSVASVIGFGVSDKTGTNSYTSDNACGSVYRPQFWIQDFMDDSENAEFANASIIESGDGSVEVYSVGLRRFMEMNIKFITDKEIGGEIEIDANAIANAKHFLSYLITKSKIEVMKDRDNVQDYKTVMLESYPGNSKGTGFKLKPMRGYSFDIFETGVMKLRVFE